jgi:hypothetical protein
MVGDVSNPLGRCALGQADHNRATNNLNAVKRHSHSIRHHSDLGKA